MLYDLDAKARAHTQEAYLYLLDRFNLMLGDALCALTILDIVVGKHNWISYIFAIFIVMFGAMLANWQRDKKYDRMNAGAESNSEGFKPARVVLICMNAVFAVIGAITFSQLAIVIVSLYLLTCKVRDRDPDRFQEGKKEEAPAYIPLDD